MPFDAGLISPARVRRAAFTGGLPKAGARGPTAEDELNARRAGIDSRFAALYQALQAMASGQDPSITNEALSNLLAEQADASAAGYGAEQRLIRRRHQAGLAGGESGAQLSAERSALRRSGEEATRGRRQIQTTAELENRAGRERALSSILGALQTEIPYQSRMEVTGEDPLATAFAKMMGGGGGGQVLSGTGQRAAGASGSLAGGASGGSSGLGWDQLWAAQNAQDEDRAAALRAQYAGSYDPSRPVGTRAGWQPSAPNPYGGMGAAAGGMTGAAVGGGGQAPTLDMTGHGAGWNPGGVKPGQAWGSISGPYGNYQGSPEAMLAKVQAGAGADSWGHPAGGYFARGGVVSQPPGAGPSRISVTPGGQPAPQPGQGDLSARLAFLRKYQPR